MQFTSDITVRDPKWRKLADIIVDKYEIIPTYVSLFIMCAALGVCDGKQLDDEKSENPNDEVNFPRAVLLQAKNADKLDFIFKAYLFSDDNTMDVEKKIKIAFLDDEDKLFKKAEPLRLCANYGAHLLYDTISDFDNAYVCMEEIYSLLKDKSLDSDSILGILNDGDIEVDDWL